MANYHKRNSIRAVQWDPENAQSFEGIKKLIAENKLTSQGKTFAKIDKWYPSSKTCSVCGFIKDDLTLADRVWTCSACGTTHNRDHNAAINIRNVGLLGLYPA